MLHKYSRAEIGAELGSEGWKCGAVQDCAVLCAVCRIVSLHSGACRVDHGHHRVDGGLLFQHFGGPVGAVPVTAISNACQTKVSLMCGAAVDWSGAGHDSVSRRWPTVQSLQSDRQPRADRRAGRWEVGGDAMEGYFHTCRDSFWVLWYSTSTWYLQPADELSEDARARGVILNSVPFFSGCAHRGKKEETGDKGAGAVRWATRVDRQFQAGQP